MRRGEGEEMRGYERRAERTGEEKRGEERRREKREERRECVDVRVYVCEGVCM